LKHRRQPLGWSDGEVPRAKGKVGKDHKKLEKGHTSSMEFYYELSSEGLALKDDLMEEDFKVDESSSQTQV